MKKFLLAAMVGFLCLSQAEIKGGQMIPKKPGEKVTAAPLPLGINKVPFGKTKDGTAVDLYVLSNGKGMAVKIITYGAIVTEILVPDKTGKPGNVALGFDSMAPYLGVHPYLGAIVGRYANRIAKGRFTLQGKEYKLAVNNGPNHLHGGIQGFDKVVWKAEPRMSPEGPGLKLSYASLDGEEGYPGSLACFVTYTVTAKNELKIEYQAATDKATPVNLTNHSYFNLAGPGSGDVLGHVVTILADKYTPVDDGLIPTGSIDPVKGTPMDFTQPFAIGARIAEVKGGYDHNWVLNSGGSASPVLAVKVSEPKSGRTMEVYTTQPGVQFYTGNFLDGTIKGLGGVYKKHYGFCLETQHFPDSPNHPNFPSTILEPGKTYHEITIYKFGAH
jgi:aldose 1-epimerase